MSPHADRAPPKTAVEEIGDRIAIAILRGEHPPGTRLPSLRDLAREHEVTLPTIQRVIARLEAQGLVSAHQGSGVVVHDPARHGELSLVPLWFRAFDADRGAEILADLLALRRVVAAHLVEESHDRVLASLPQLLGVVSELYGADDLGRRIDLDLAFTRTLLEAQGSFAASAVFRTIERLVREVPWVAEAFYGDGTDHDAALAAMARTLGSDDVAAGIDDALAAWDAATVDRYRRLAA